MACYHPIPALQMESNGAVRLWPPKGAANLALPCGKCLGCRTARATQWAQRCGHEARRYDFNTFVTLTYDDDNLPESGALQPQHLTNFLKRLRSHASRRSDGVATDRTSTIRYFGCGEYGERQKRPHYHAILFNCRFTDEERAGKDLFRSDTLARLWGHGECRHAAATAASANYIAQYSLKKIGLRTEDHPGDVDPDTGEWLPRPPFLRMSLKPAIGAGWLSAFATDLQDGFLVHDGKPSAIPRTYLERLKKSHPQLAERIEHQKARRRIANPSDANTPERQEAAEIIHQRRKELTENRTL